MQLGGTGFLDVTTAMSESGKKQLTKNKLENKVVLNISPNCKSIPFQRSESIEILLFWFVLEDISLSILC